MATGSNLSFPFDPLGAVTPTPEYRRRTIAGILESYHSNYDVLAEAVQNGVDALEDAFLSDLASPFTLEVTINLKENWIGVLDTGIGMTFDQVCEGFAPNVSFKSDPTLITRRGSGAPYRGYKGVGLTFLAYGTDEVAIHSKRNGEEATKARMQYGRAWAAGERDEPAQVIEDNRASPIDRHARGTYVQVYLSNKTRPKQLFRLASTPEVWSVILRTRTAVGQVLLGRNELVKIDVGLKVIDQNQVVHTCEVKPSFLYPHEVQRTLPFQFLDIPDYYEKYGERTDLPPDKVRQDGLYLVWNTERIAQELTSDQRKKFEAELGEYSPHLYAFIPYQGSVWGEMNNILTGTKTRSHLYAGLMIAVNGQRLADIFDIAASRFETLSRNIFVVVHHKNARPDQGRKTLQDEALELAQKAADRAVQYLSKQRGFLRPPGESPTPEQREMEQNHDDWIFNVKKHAEVSPLHLPPATFLSKPLTEQDVVGLFHQLSALGIFPGIKIYATSQSHTYDCLVKYECPSDTEGLRYESVDKNPLGVSPYILGERPHFRTRDLTLEFKSNLDALIDETENEGKKSFRNIHVCICWSTVSDTFTGYAVEEITESNIDERQYPGVTHLLRKDGEGHVIQVIMLEKVAALIQAGNIPLPPSAPAGASG